MQYLHKPDPAQILAYYEDIRPLLAQMANLVLLYRHPMFEIGTNQWGKDGIHLTHYVWINPEMEAVYDHLEQIITEMREHYFARRPE